MLDQTSMLMISLLMLSQTSKMAIFVILVAIIFFIPGVKDKVSTYINNGYSGLFGARNQVSAPGNAQNPPAAGGPNGGEGQGPYGQQQFQASTQGFGQASGFSPASA